MSAPLPDPARKLRKRTYEAFAKARAAGRTLADSYADAFGKPSTARNNNTLKVSGKRLNDRPEVAARIQFLIEEQRARRETECAELDPPKNLGRSDILEIVLETTRTLESAYEALLKTGLPEIRRRQFYATLSSHLARQSKMLETGAELTDDNRPVVNMIDRLNQKFGDCACQN